MARLLQQSYPMPKVESSRKREQYQEQYRLLRLELEGKDVVRFPVADGYAEYLVVSVSPPVLQHIPIGDGYQIPYTHMRGIRGKDIRLMLDRGLREAWRIERIQKGEG